MSKINFSIIEKSGRSFELNKSDLEKAYLELGYDSCENVEINNMIIEVLGHDLGYLDEFEMDSSYFEWSLN